MAERDCYFGDGVIAVIGVPLLALVDAGDGCEAGDLFSRGNFEFDFDDVAFVEAAAWDFGVEDGEF